MKFQSEVYESSAFASDTFQQEQTYEPAENSYEDENNYGVVNGTITSGVRQIQTLEVTIEVNQEQKLVTGES